MALEVKRKQGETFESLLRRFTKRTIQSGKLLQAKKIKYYQKPKTKRERKESALKREDFRKLEEHWRLMGKLIEN